MPAWFKLLLAWLAGLLILLLWLGSVGNPSDSSQKEVIQTPSAKKDVVASKIKPTRSKQPSPTIIEQQHDDIKMLIQPLLKNNAKTVTLTFEDELPEPVPSYTAPSAPSKPNQTHKTATSDQRIAVLIDDVGYDLHALQRLIALPFTISVAILPDAPHAKEAAQMAHQHGIKVMLHMPMQTSNPKYQQKMERFYLHNAMSKAEFINVFEAALAKVPYAEGINNHMGSLLTSNKQYMQWLMQLCLKHGLFFIDSRTASTSVAAAQADQAGIAWNQRDVFLDHKTDAASLQHAWDSSLKCLQKNDHCIVIGHPHQETLNFLEHHAKGLDAQNFIAIDALLYD